VGWSRLWKLLPPELSGGNLHFSSCWANCTKHDETVYCPHSTFNIGKPSYQYHSGNSNEETTAQMIKFNITDIERHNNRKFLPAVEND
jgi:hypothetical protein